MEQAEPGDQRKETNKTYVLVFHFYYLVINRNFIMSLAGATFLSEGFPGKWRSLCFSFGWLPIASTVGLQNNELSALEFSETVLTQPLSYKL